MKSFPFTIVSVGLYNGEMKANKKLIILILSICTIIFLSKYFGLTNFATTEKLTLLLRENIIISSFIFIILFCVANLLYIPGWIIISAPILVLPPMNAYLLILVGAITSCCLSFFLIGYFGKGLLNELNNKYANKALIKLEQRPLLTVFALRILMQTNPALNYTLSMSKIRFKDYFLGTVLGLPLPIAIYCIFYDFITDFLGYS